MRNLPNVTKNLLLINLVVWLLDAVLGRSGFYLTGIAGLYPFWSNNFQVWQPLTYMFMHSGFSHLFCNMFAVMMFGPVLEHEWGERRFLIYYLSCGIGAGLVQELVWWVIGTTYACTIGASGAVFGILFAFGWLFPETEMMLLFPPIPMRARTFVLIYAGIELMLGIGSLSGGGLFSADNVAHFAHLGGMLFGWLLLLWWRSNMPGRCSDWWHRLTGGHRHTTLDSSKEKDYSGYHYQKRV